MGETLGHAVTVQARAVGTLGTAGAVGGLGLQKDMVGSAL